MNNKNDITCECKTRIIAMLLQSDLNKWRLSQWSKLDKLYNNYAPTKILQISNIYLIEHRNQKLQNNSHIHLRAYDTA